MRVPGRAKAASLAVFFIGVLALAACASPASAQRRRGGSVYVRGYVRKDGTYVQPHYRSAPDGKFHNNWSTKGNVNPYTGKPGTRVSPPGTGAGGYGLVVPATRGNPVAGSPPSEAGQSDNGRSGGEPPVIPGPGWDVTPPVAPYQAPAVQKRETEWPDSREPSQPEASKKPAQPKIPPAYAVVPRPVQFYLGTVTEATPVYSTSSSTRVICYATPGDPVWVIGEKANRYQALQRDFTALFVSKSAVHVISLKPHTAKMGWRKITGFTGGKVEVGHVFRSDDTIRIAVDAKSRPNCIGLLTIYVIDADRWAQRKAIRCAMDAGSSDYYWFTPGRWAIMIDPIACTYRVQVFERALVVCE